MIFVKNVTSYKLNAESFAQVAKKVLFWENKEKESISIVFVDKEEIQKLNKQFRGKDQPTDVLSFNLDEKDLLGELIVCPEVVQEHAKEYQVPVDQEMIKMVVHGVLHLLGYDHERSPNDEVVMEEKQNTYVSRLIKNTTS